MAVNCACLSLGGCCSPFSFSPDHYLASIIDVIMPERRGSRAHKQSSSSICGWGGEKHRVNKMDYPLFRPSYSCRPFSCPPDSCRDRFVPRKTYSCPSLFMSKPFRAQWDRFMSDPIHVHLFMSDPIHV